MSRRVVLSALLVGPLLGCGGNDSTSPSPMPSAPPVGGCAAGAPVSGIPALGLRTIASGLSRPLDLQSVPEDPERLYVVEQFGRIKIIRNGELQPRRFLDLSTRILAGGERGLLGLAFHPDFASNRRFYVNYTNPSGDTHIAEFTATSADEADPDSERVVLVVPQPFANHNAGGLAFGNDGLLYVALGDGGGRGDPMNTAQALDTLLGKILRIDVDSGAPYTVPSDNPFVSTPGAEPEIWAYGLRNPYRIAFDRATGDLYIGDVGQRDREEIDVGRSALGGGENYGWKITEGTLCFDPPAGCSRAGQTMPVVEYGHGEGCSVTGGAVYAGCRMPDLVGTYFYGDFCTALVRSFRLVDGVATENRDWSEAFAEIESISSFGTDFQGEVYIVEYAGRVFKIEPAG